MASKRDMKRKHRKRRERDRRRTVRHAAGAVRSARQAEKDRERLLAKIKAAALDETVEWHMVEAQPNKVGALCEALAEAKVPFLRAQETRHVIRRGRRVMVELPVMGRIVFAGFPARMTSGMVASEFRHARSVQSRPVSTVPTAKALAKREGDERLWPAFLEQARTEMGFRLLDMEPIILSAEDLSPFAGCLAGTIARDAPPEPEWTPGEAVRVLDGPFASFPGVVEAFHEERDCLTVGVAIFGRVAPVELAPEQVERT